MTEVSERKAVPSRTARIPCVFRPGTLLAVNLACFILNWLVAFEEPYGFDIILTCKAQAERTTALTGVLIGIYVLAALSIVLAVLWCRRKRARGGHWAAIILTAAPVIAFALLNLWMAYITQADFLTITVPCT